MSPSPIGSQPTSRSRSHGRRCGVVSTGRRRYAIEIKPSAARALRLLPAPARARLLAEIAPRGDDPQPPGCKKLAGRIDRYRVRAAGAYRVVYEIDDGSLIVVVIRVGHRREVYRGLWVGKSELASGDARGGEAVRQGTRGLAERGARPVGGDE